MRLRAWPAAILVGCSNDATVIPNDAGVADVEEEPRATPDDARVNDAKLPPASGILVNGPDLLSQTGLYSDFSNRTIAPGIIPFEPRWPSWSDGALKQRWIQVPQGKTVDTTDMNQWSFPIGTKLWQEFTYGKVVETRFLWKQGDDWPNWWMGAYVWRQDGSDADYSEKGVVDVLGTGHDAPSQLSCVLCHNGVTDVGIGFSALQLSAPQNSQLALFSSMGLLSKPATQEYEPPGTGVTRDALIDLHAECGNCHVETSKLYMKQTQLVLRLRLGDATPQDTGAYAAIGMKAKHQSPLYGDYNIYPGRPDLSQVLIRIALRDNGQWQMPPLDTKKIEVSDVKAVSDWIAALPPGPDL
jgi:hypothetical protein